MSLNQKQIKDLVFADVTAAEASGRPDEVCYVQTLKTFYDYVVAGSEYTVNHTSILSTGNGGNTRWRARAGLYIVDGAQDPYAEMYLNNNGNVTVLETANIPIALRHFTTGALSGWTFNAGSTGAITAYADGTGKVNVASAAHGLVTDDIISIRGTTNYNGVWQITKIDDNNFSIPDTWVVDDGASDWDEGSHLIAGSNVAGMYAMSWNISQAEGGAAGSYITVQIYVNTTADAKGIARRSYANNDQRSVSGQSLITIADGDKIYIMAQSTGTNDVTNQYGNVTMRRR